jgi:hypothetical protein
MTGTKRDPPSISPDTARAVLLHLMECDSQHNCAAGWTSGNEYRLWSQAIRDPVVAGKVWDYPPHSWMRELSRAAQGWWIWPHDAMSTPGPSFVTMPEWLPIYEARRQKLIEQHGPEGLAARLPLAEQENRLYLKAFREEIQARPDRPQTYAIRRETAAAQLLRLMEQESRYNWSSRWGSEHEYMLWASVVGDEPKVGRGRSSDPARLMELATLAHGWFSWREELDDVEFVSMGPWVVLYRQYREAQKSESNGVPRT